MTTPRARWLTRNLLVLTLVSLFQDTASELLYPLLPVLITGVLAAPPVVLGVIEGVSEAVAGVTRYVSGRRSDRGGRRGLIGAGYGLAAVGKVLVAAAGAWPTVLAGRVVDRLGKGVRSAPRDALIAASVPREHLGKAFGFHRAGDTVGAVVGPLLGLLALGVMGGNLHHALWWAVVPAAVSAGLVVLVRDTGSGDGDGTSTGGTPGERHGVGTAVDPAPRADPAHRSPLPPSFWWVVGLLVVIGLVNFSDTLVLLRVSELGFGTAQVVLAYVLFNAVYAVASYPAGALTDRWPRAYVYAVGLLAFTVGYLGLAAVRKGPAVFVLLAVYGLFPALTDGVGKAWISSLVPAEHRGRAQGVFQGLSSAAVLVAGLWAGLAWDVGRGAGTVPLLVAGAGGLVGAVALPVLHVHLRARPERAPA